MPTPYAREFTPEFNQEYLANSLNQIEDETAKDKAQARQEGVSAGLVGQAATGSRIGAIEAGEERAKYGTINAFNMDVANKKYSERMTNEARDSEHLFADTERQKDEDFRMTMAKMGYEFADSQRNNQNRADKILGEQGLLEGSLATIGVNALNPGNYLGGKKGG